MVARITVPNSILKALNYNEQKLQQGKADCIHAHNFLKEAAQMNFHEKADRFNQLIALNKRATTNTFHVSLNFSPDEKLDSDKLVAIANDYMVRIGFGEQPYLVYRHHDAGHPHMHIVSTNIQQDGKRISLHNLGRDASTNARKAIEEKYGLVKAENQAKHQDAIKPMNASRVNYGKSETKRGITNVLDAVLNSYRYASLPELNAVLKLYNIIADRGNEDGFIHKKGGLHYRVLDSNGNKVGVPIKSSSIHSRPTLHFLEKRFTENAAIKHKYKSGLKSTIDWVLLKQPKDLESFRQGLEKERISLVKREKADGLVYGLTYVDHKNKCVFNGSDIGKGYTAKGIMDKCGIKQAMPVQKRAVNPMPPRRQVRVDGFNKESIGLLRIVDAVIMPEEQFSYLPYDLKKRKKKKKKSNHS